MTIVENATFIIVMLAYVAFCGKRLLTYMHVLQQEDYDNKRLFKWMKTNKAFDKRVSMSLMGVFALIMVLYAIGHREDMPQFILYFVIFITFVLGAYLEKDPRKSTKKRLVSTPRAKRIFIPAFIVSILLFLPYHSGILPLALILNIQALPFILMLVKLALQPFEDIIQAGYWREAQEKITDYRPQIIGITGSYGKTSVKHILGHVLSTQAPTLMTPGSVNTPMGITRVIREQLEPNHQYLVVEMGAYGPGSIERLCKLAPPNYGIITSIGHAHYERFKSLDTVAKAKFELAEAVIAKGGKTIIHERTLRFAHARALKTTYPDSFIVCGDIPNPNPHNDKDISYIQPEDLQIEKIEQKPSGLAITLRYKNIVYSPEIPIYGTHHAHNIALVFALCVEMGISTDAIQDALATLPQIAHRLEVIRQPDGSIMIDDAYNSNPIGFQSALNLLGTLKDSYRKILITPGMVELGLAHDEAHKKIGEAAGSICDICLVVQPARIPSFLAGFKESGSGKTLMEFDSFQEAQNWYVRNKTNKDIVLIENDLPDMYEKLPKM